MYWMLLLLALSYQNVPTQANFGLSVSLSGVNLLISKAKDLDGALDTITQNMRNLKSPGQTEKLQSVANLIHQLTQNVTTLGKFITGNMTNASADKSTPVTDLFSTLHKPLIEMSEFLTSEAQMITTSLNSTLGITSITDITRVLHSFHDAVLNITSITTNIEMEIGKISEDSNVSTISNLTTSLSEALVQMKNHVISFTNIITPISRDIDAMTSYLANFLKTTKSAEQTLNANQYVKSQIPAEKDNALRRYYAYHSAINSDLSAAVEKLEVFTRSRELQPLINRHYEEYTKIFYYLYRRNTSDVTNITSAYDTIESISGKLVQQHYSNFSNQIQRIVFKLTDLYLERKPNVEFCYRKYSNELLSPFNGVQNAIGNCLYKERGRLGRTNGATEQILQLIQQNSQDFAANIASCASQSNLANFGNAYEQAIACLTTNLDQMAEFQQLIDSEFDEILRVYAIEIAATRFRQSICLASRTNEAQAAALTLETQLVSCVSGARSGLKFVTDESSKLSVGVLKADQEETAYELVDLLI